MERVTYIGKTNYHKSILFGIKDQDRSGHIYCLGKTGSGKSTLLLNMVISDIQKGYGVSVLDPHGDLSEKILDYIPQDRIKDVIYFNPADRHYPLSFNPLANVSSDFYYLTVSNIVSTFKKIWIDSWGPRLEHILSNSLLTLMYCPDATLVDIQPLLTSSEFRKNVIDNVTDQALRDFWYKEFLPMPVYLKAEAISPILNKVGLLTIHPLLRSIVGQKASTIDFRNILDSKKIFIANLSKGHIGEAGSHFLGSMLLTQLQTAALSRANLPIEERSNNYIYVDEMHSFVTLSFADMLSESRKYGLALFLTHQYMDQLSDEIRNAIIGNVGTVICFRIGGTDAELLEKEFFPVFTKEDLVALPQYHIYLKLMIDGASSQPFSATTLPITWKKYNLSQEIIKESRRKYSLPIKNETIQKKNDFEYSSGSLFS